MQQAGWLLGWNPPPPLPLRQERRGALDRIRAASAAWATASPWPMAHEADPRRPGQRKVSPCGDQGRGVARRAGDWRRAAAASRRAASGTSRDANAHSVLRRGPGEGAREGGRGPPRIPAGVPPPLPRDHWLTWGGGSTASIWPLAITSWSNPSWSWDMGPADSDSCTPAPTHLNSVGAVTIHPTAPRVLLQSKKKHAPFAHTNKKEDPKF